MKPTSHWKPAFLTAMLTLFTAGASLAQSQMNYQGRLTEPNGNAVPDAQYPITFHIYDLATGGTNKWGPQVITADVVQGRFNVILGPTDTASRNIVSAFDGGTRYLQITYQGNPILPRQQILSAPTAFYSQTAGQLANVFVLNGNVGIGTTNPRGLLTVGAYNNTNEVVPFAVLAGTAGAPATSGATQTNGSLRIGTNTGNSQILDMGLFNAPPFGAWFQTANSGALNEAYPLALNPNGGNVGIGTSAPTVPLHVNGKIAARTTTATDGFITLAPGTSGAAGHLEWFKPGPTRIGYLGWADGGVDNLGLNLESGANFNINGGNVGIGGLLLVNGATPGTSPLRLKAIDAGLGFHNLMSLQSANVANPNWTIRYMDPSVITNGGGLSFVNGASQLILFRNDGNVGIGTTTPTQAKLVISGGVSYTSPGQNGILRNDGAYDFSNDPTTRNLGIYADNSIAANTFIAHSDARIKNIKGRSDGKADLRTLMGVEIANYTYRDVIAKGATPQKKVIAQQVEAVYPQAVSKTTGVVPDIYQKATVQDGWVALATDLKVGERVRLIGEKEEAIHEVLEVREGAFRTAFQPATDAVFVYGREVQDFRSVDYEAIAMLNVSATQELARKLAAQSAESTQLRAALTKLRAEQHALAQEVAALTARDQAREARLTRLESALTPRTVNASLK